MAKTLKNTLEKIDDNELLYIGAKEGNGFVVIDTKKAILDKMLGINKYVHRRAENNLKHYISVLETTPSLIIKRQDEIKTVRKVVSKLIDEGVANDKTIAFFDEYIEKLESGFKDLESTYANAYNGRKTYTDMLKKWVDWSDRKVVETYIHETEEVGTVILVEGLEQGELWFRNEKKIQYR